ncbi:Mg-protoporyphyrin IX chelatase, partial [mine drainage metagenome]
CFEAEGLGGRQDGQEEMNEGCGAIGENPGLTDRGRETMGEREQFPFTAVLGNDTLRLALILAEIDPSIGGVLALGEKGSAKSTVARSFAKLLHAGSRFVELPIGATEEMLSGTIDIESAIREGEKRHIPGLLARADKGILYVDEVNLLPDHLVDALLDSAASGMVRVERDGI